MPRTPIRVTHFMRRPEPGAHSVERLFEDLRQHLGTAYQVKVSRNRFLSRGFFRRCFDIFRAATDQSEINHVTGDVHFLTYLLDRRRTILTILDCVMLERLTGYRRWLLWLLWYWLPEKHCAVITVISETTRQEVLRHLHCAPDKVQVIHCHVSAEFQPSPKPFNTLRPRILQIGTNSNKNLERVALALEGLDCELTIIGRLSPEQSRILQRSRVAYQNFFEISRETLVEHYRQCDLLLFASTYEGFGLPIIEAQAVGRPVVTSALWSMPEVAGAGACLVDPFDVSSIRFGLCRVIEDPAFRTHLIDAGFENVKRFRVDTIAAQYAKLYLSLHTELARQI